MTQPADLAVLVDPDDAEARSFAAGLYALLEATTKTKRAGVVIAALAILIGRITTERLERADADLVGNLVRIIVFDDATQGSPNGLPAAHAANANAERQQAAAD